MGISRGQWDLGEPPKALQIEAGVVAGFPGQRLRHSPIPLEDPEGEIALIRKLETGTPTLGTENPTVPGPGTRVCAGQLGPEPWGTPEGGRGAGATARPAFRTPASRSLLDLLFSMLENQETTWRRVGSPCEPVFLSGCGESGCGIQAPCPPPCLRICFLPPGCLRALGNPSTHQAFAEPVSKCREKYRGYRTQIHCECHRIHGSFWSCHAYVCYF